jgi:hypothetical protein
LLIGPRRDGSQRLGSRWCVWLENVWILAKEKCQTWRFLAELGAKLCQLPAAARRPVGLNTRQVLIGIDGQAT